MNCSNLKGVLRARDPTFKGAMLGQAEPAVPAWISILCDESPMSAAMRDKFRWRLHLGGLHARDVTFPIELEPLSVNKVLLENLPFSLHGVPRPSLWIDNTSCNVHESHIGILQGRGVCRQIGSKEAGTLHIIEQDGIPHCLRQQARQGRDPEEAAFHGRKIGTTWRFAAQPGPIP